jgi:uncharacterized Zn finger protein
MYKLAELTEKDIQAFCPGANFERGLNYYKHGQIMHPVQRGKRIEARCQGSMSHPYQLWVTLNDTGIQDAGCSCPIGFGCKHIAALLLTWMHHPEQFHAAQTVDEQLAQRNKDELILLIKAMIARQPDLEILLELPLPGTKAQKTIDPEPIRRQLQMAFDDAYEWGRSFEVAAELASILQMAKPFAEAGDWVNAKMIYQLVLQEGLANYEYVGHDEGEVIGEINHAAVQLAGCLPAFADDAETRADILTALFDLVRWDTEMGGYGAADDITEVLLTQTNADEKQRLREWIMQALTKTDEPEEFSRQWQREHWGHLLLPLIDKEAFDTFLPQARSMGLHRSLFDKFIQLGRIDEAIKIALEDTDASDYTMLQFAQRLEKAGQTKQAVNMVETRIAHITDERLLVWLAEKREQTGNIQGAIDLHLRCWKENPSLTSYQTLERLIGKQDEWDTLRTKLVSGLMKSNRDISVLARIHLYEKAWNAAWTVIGEEALGNWNDAIRDEVAQATEQHCPKQVIAYYLSKASQLIRQRGRDNYASAARYLKNVEKILNRTGQKDTWQQTISQIRQDHRNLPALKDELNKAGLD